ncbi:MAG: GDSL-type esterase/lipase family protein, partial [Flavobacteriales bacterium]|nr:GDSL-type esterase/lipase family protein [Flavobacteriales bacterium]
DAETNFKVAPVRFIAQNRWTTAKLINAVNNANIDTTYRLVSLLIGVNNQYENRPIDEYTEQFEILLARAIELAADEAERVFVVSIPDYGVTPFAESMNSDTIAAEIDAFNAMNSTIAADYGVSYFNITDISRDAEGVPGMLAPDNLHPSAAQYSLWVDSFYEQVKSKLND